ncbi:hypothetical protein F5Y13DRAFT_204558 [Hypoxylon sp. FL1857]|nr:hypothetical protein F5Y13DRAFT_204558 [Hypoxylon sp. FL1857]
MWTKIHNTFWCSVHVFLSLGPMWFTFYLALAPYANDYLYCWLSLMAPQDTGIGFGDPVAPQNWYLGLCMILVSAILKANWFGAWLQIFMTTRFCDRHWKPPKNPSSKRIMQADRATWEHALPGGRLVYIEGRRPRRCPFGCQFDLSDRVYHCQASGQCFPVYDHYCDYLRSAVYLRTMKPYCFVLVFLPLDALYSFSVSLAALCDPYTRWTAPFVASMLATSVAFFFVLMMNSPDGLQRLVWRNSVGPEVSGVRWTLAFKYQERDGTHLRLHNFEKNPWDLGPKENFRQVFGQHWWMWPFFWWTSERVSRYGNYVDRDLPFADFVTEEFTDQIMSRLTSVTIDPPAPSSIHGEGPNRRQSARSDAERRSQQQSDNAATNHVGAFARHQRGGRRHTEGHSSSHDRGI